MVKVEELLKEGKISTIKETESDRYVGFFDGSYKDNLKHSETNVDLFPRWSIISGYYAMHDISKLLIAKAYRLKINKEVHATTIKVIREFVKDKEVHELIERAYNEFQGLADDLNDAKKERVKVQYYTGTDFMKEKYKKVAKDFHDNVVKPFVEKIKGLIGE